MLLVPPRDASLGDSASSLRIIDLDKAAVGVSSPPASRYCVFTKGAGLAMLGVLQLDDDIQSLFAVELGVAESDREY